MLSFKKNKNPTEILNWRSNPKSIEKYQFVHHFLPHPEFKRRATLLSNKALVIYCISILVLATTLKIIPVFMPGVLGYASNINIRDLLTYTNNKRHEIGLSNLRLNEALSKAAYAKAQHMFDHNYWAHISPDGTEPWDFILGADYDYIYAGENLAKNFSTSKEVVEAWYKSPSHKDNLLSPNYDEIGFAVVNGVLDGYETTLVVQMFGRPRNANQVASVYEEDKVLQDSTVKSMADSGSNISNTTGIPDSPIENDSSVSNVSNVSNVSDVYVTSDNYENKEGILAKLVSFLGLNIPKVQKVYADDKPLLDVNVATRAISLVIGGFLGSLLTLDIWYSKKRGILKFTGHTFAHLALLVTVVISIWFVLKPGVVL